MPEQNTPQAPEILREIHEAERSVEAMLRQAEREAAEILERARAEAASLLAEKHRGIEQRQSSALAAGLAEAKREAEQLLTNAQANASDMRAHCMGRIDEAVDLVLDRILPGWDRLHD
ncbi:MAG: hypothetical protein CV081_02355 [Nitrospira sp. LK265]|nr:V-type ATPase subunit subunit G family protein [Nitrospira sp.]NGZ59332.1 hypothetical protein [Nitrospira sp. LK265]